MTTIVVLPDPHGHPDHDNSRADLVGRLLLDLKPDVFVNLGDTWDMAALSSYDKGKRDFHGRTYAKDIAAGIEFNERMFAPLRKSKRRQPRKVFLIGNHEERISRALDLSPELDGTISYKDLQLDRDYHDVVEYTGNTPGTIEIEGIQFAHYMVSGIMGRPIGGQHPAYTLIANKYQSCVVGHSHVYDYCIRSNGNGRNVQGLVAGCFVDYQPSWAGEITKLWINGVTVLRNVSDGQFDPQFISLEALKEIYKNEVESESYESGADATEAAGLDFGVAG